MRATKMQAKPSDRTNGNPGSSQCGFCLGDGNFAEMEDRSGQNRAGMALGDTCDKVIEAADATTGDHRDRYGIGDGAGQFQVVALLRPVTVHRSDEQLARTQCGEVHGMGQRVNASGLASAVGEYLPFARPGASRIDRTNHALRAELLGYVAYQFGAGDSGGIEVHPESLKKELPKLPKKVAGLDVSAHARNFFDCVKSRENTAANPGVMRRSHIACHAAALSWILQRKLRFDPEREVFIDDDEANSLRARPARDPWKS